METMLQTVGVGVGAEAGAEKATAVNEAMRAHMLSLLRDYNEQQGLSERLSSKGDQTNARIRATCAETLETQISEASRIARLLSEWSYDAIYSAGVRRYTALLIWRDLYKPAPGEKWDSRKSRCEAFRVEV